MHTEAFGSNWRSADDLVLGAENLLFPPSAIALGPPTQFILKNEGNGGGESGYLNRI